jgi:hypothetical protein
MKKTFPQSTEFIYQLFSLIIVIILVHALYVAIIRPGADAFLTEQAALMETDPSHVTEQSVFVIIRDYEQETCFILMLWALAIMAYKAFSTTKHRALLLLDLIPLACFPGYCWQPCNASVQPATYRMFLMPPTLTVLLKESGWTQSCPWSGISPGLFLPLGLLGQCGVLDLHLVRPTKQCKGTSLTSPRAWGLLLTQL